MKKINIRKLIISFAIVAIIVIASSLITVNTFDYYDTLVKPKLAPKAFLFPIVWTILYIILAITLYLIYDNKKITISLLFNLVINVIWPILFFKYNLLLISSIWLGLIIISLIYLLCLLYKEKKLAFYLNIPYLLWCLFALYLNIAVFVLN